jgi:hypothetical protein
MKWIEGLFGNSNVKDLIAIRQYKKRPAPDKGTLTLYMVLDGII